MRGNDSDYDNKSGSDADSDAQNSAEEGYGGEDSESS